MAQLIIEKCCYILSAKPQQIKQKCSKAHISSSAILADKDATITAKETSIDGKYNIYRESITQESKTTGLTVSFSHGLLDLGQSLYAPISRIGEVQDDRLKGVYAWQTGRNCATTTILPILQSISFEKLSPEAKSTFSQIMYNLYNPRALHNILSDDMVFFMGKGLFAKAAYGEVPSE